jgi:lipoprotein NlpI
MLTRAMAPSCEERAAGADPDELAKNSAKVALAEWPGLLVALYLGKGTADQARTAARQNPSEAATERDCEAAFYIGEYELLRKNITAAEALFQDALKTYPFTADELDGAQVELKRLH